MSPEKPIWEPPGHLLPYGRHTNYPDRAAELFNSDATPFNNTPLFIMHVETQAQWALLERLHAHGQLRPPAPRASRARTWLVIALMVIGILGFSAATASFARQPDGWPGVVAFGLLSAAATLAALYDLIRNRSGAQNP